MGLIGKLEDEFIDRIFTGLKEMKNENKRQVKFSITWDTVRDEYEFKFGRDALYFYMWLYDKFVMKEILAGLRAYPASREFVQNISVFVQKKMGDEWNREAFLNFFQILFEQLLYNEEFSEKMIRVRQDWENGYRIKNPDCDLLKIEVIENRNLEDRNKENNGIIHNDAVLDIFSHNFIDVLFMQRPHEPQIQLKDVYIENDYDVQLGKSKPVNLLLYIYQFCCEDYKEPVLFIEGHAGIGKSSLISKMAYDFKNGLEIWRKKRLAIIQLRYLVQDENLLDVNNPWSDFKIYLGYDGTMRNFFNLMDDYVLVLDGFDELCLIDNIRLGNKIRYVANLLNVLEDYQCGCKIIITTRPNYLAKRDEWNIYQNPNVIYLNHFSLEKRYEWIELAKGSGMIISKDVEKNLLSDMHKDVEAVASTPFTLYLIVHENIIISKDEEIWSVYMKIFGEEVMRKRYDRLNDEEEICGHPGKIIASIIYELTKEIAYYMFCTNKMDISWDEIDECIDNLMADTKYKLYYEELEISGDIKSILKDSYALFSYYQETKSSGGISFYHNYIREFFVQEKIHEKLKEIYIEGIKQRDNQGLKSSQSNIKKGLLGLLRQGRLSDKTLDFLKSYGTVNKERGGWHSIENKTGFMKKIFTDIIINSDIETNDENVIINIWMLLDVVNSIYTNEKQLYEVFDKKLVLASKGKDNIEIYLELISKAIDIQNVDFQDINLNGRNLKGITFSGCSFRKAILSGANLEQVKFKDCNLQGINLNGATMNNVLFSNTKLEGGKLRGVVMLFGDFINCTMSECQMQGSKIRNIKFSKTDIEKSILNGSEFILSEIVESERIFENIDAFKYADLGKLKWEKESDKIKFYNKK